MKADEARCKPVHRERCGTVELHFTSTSRAFECLTDADRFGEHVLNNLTVASPLP